MKNYNGQQYDSEGHSDRLSLIPFSVALEAYQRIPDHMRTTEMDPNAYASFGQVKLITDVYLARCPTCGTPADQRGFVRMVFPIGHPFFGRAVCCPRCWPAPFGKGKGTLSTKSQKVAQMWQSAIE